MRTSDYLELLEQRLEEAAGAAHPLSSLAEALGHIQLSLAQFIVELSNTHGECSDPEELLEALVAIGAASARAAEELVLPAIRRSND